VAETLGLNKARNAVLYSSKESPIIRWMLSDEWTTPKVTAREKNNVQKYGRTQRGMLVKSGLATHCDILEGEIQCRH
jgi:hypothetical protein